MRIQVKVIPNASQSVIIPQEDTWKIKVQTPPENGRANKEIIKLIAKFFDVPRSDVKIISGESSKTKIIEVFGLLNQ